MPYKFQRELNRKMAEESTTDIIKIIEDENIWGDISIKRRWQLTRLLFGGIPLGKTIGEHKTLLISKEVAPVVVKNILKIAEERIHSPSGQATSPASQEAGVVAPKD